MLYYHVISVWAQIGAGKGYTEDTIQAYIMPQ